MTKLIMALGGAGLAALATVLAVALGGAGQPTTSVGTLPAPAPGVSRATASEARDDDAAEDVSGPCDEAEHANDPRCTGAAETQPRVDDDSPNHDAGDDHGNHANDDRSGHGGGGDDDRSGSNSGRG